MLELKNINFSADGKHILKDISLSLDSGKFIAITGPNGSGKSTLAKVIMGIEKPDSGQILFKGQDITNYSIDERARMGISFGFQQPVRFKGITVHDLLNLASRKKLSSNEACEILSTVGLCANSYVDREVNSSLSGGELKRIEIASVMMRGSNLTIFDEPEAGIDLWSFNNLIKVFNNMRASLEGSIIVISHQERILNIADEIVLLADGRVERVIPHGEPLESFINMQACRKL
ncbi:MAG: ATP-binding cassette domain-containing protein [Clostridiales bacterium]|jgi:Fe-S cluster assembly ATP-binding protein|nr:ATP-binding cassette domain-containing protein [Clostridiales bacterium]